MNMNMKPEEIIELFRKYVDEEKIPFIMDPRDTESLTEEEFNEIRNAPNRFYPYGIGGSDIGRIISASRFGSKTDLYLEKLGKAPKEEPDEAKLGIFEAGHIEEPRVREDIARDLSYDYGEANVRVYAPKCMLGCGKKDEDGSLRYPWMRLNIDGLVELCDADGVWHLYGLEIKTLNCDTPGAYKKISNWKDGIVPEDYYGQISYYMAGLGLDGYIIACKWGMHPANRTWIFVEKDPVYEEELLEECESFVECLTTETLPEDSDPKDPGKLMSTYMASVYSKQDDDEQKPCVELGESYAEVVTDLIRNESEVVIKAEKRLDAAQQKTEELLLALLPAFRESNSLSCSLSPKETAYITAYPRRTMRKFDEEGFKADHPAEYAECLSRRGKSAGKFSKAMAERKYLRLVKEYTSGGEMTGEWNISIAVYDNENKKTKQRTKSRLTGCMEWMESAGTPAHLPSCEKDRLTAS